MNNLQYMPMIDFEKMDERRFSEWLEGQSDEVKAVSFLLSDGTLAQKPVVEDGAYVHPTAQLIGGIIVRKGAFIGPYAVIRLDEKTALEPLIIDEEANVQDGAIVHSTASRIGRRAIVAHQAIVHGARMEDGAALYIQAVADSGAVIGEGSFLHQGSYVGKNIEIAPGRLVPAGAKILTQREADSLPPVPDDIKAIMQHVVEDNISHARKYIKYDL